MSTSSSPAPARARRLSRVATLVALVAIAGLVALPRVDANAAGPTLVSLTFDDGSVDQYTNGRPLLRKHGVNATFYINSGRVNSAGFLSRTQIDSLVAEGDEIGGHTVGHADLPTMPADDQRREVCNDRVALLNMGYPVKHLAYPYGDANATTEQVAQECGYNSARTVGGLRSPTSCRGCPTAETVQPRDPYYAATPNSVRTETTLADLQSYVLQAEQNGGGWVPLVLHHVCDGCGGVYAVKPALLDAFLAWLTPRSANGTVVRTVDQVLGGPVRPGVPGPPLPTPADGNLIQNPSLESATSTGVPTCFQRSGFGANTFAWSRSTDAHTGAYAEQITVSGFTSGDRKLVTRQDTGTCVPAATPGRPYRVRLWYKGNWGPTALVKLTVYYRNTSGAWVYWTSGPSLPATSVWTQTPAFTTPPAPAGATGLSFGLALAGVGTLLTDDYTLIAG